MEKKYYSCCLNILLVLHIKHFPALQAFSRLPSPSSSLLGNTKGYLLGSPVLGATTAGPRTMPVAACQRQALLEKASSTLQNSSPTPIGSPGAYHFLVSLLHLQPFQSPVACPPFYSFVIDIWFCFH